MKHRLMALFGFSSRTSQRMESLEKRGQLTVDRADEAAARADRIRQVIQRENQQYAERLHDRKSHA